MIDLPPFLQPPAIIIQLKQEQEQKPEKPKEQTYTVVKGDSLTSISELFNVPLQRLWQANLQLTHPDVLNVGEVLKIPHADEVLPERAMPTPPTIEQPVARGPVTGNTYGYGYCTWYAKNRRPDLPNSLGNANTWYSRYTGNKGTAPRAGAIGTTTAGGLGHVVYVEAVNADGTVTVSEMNFKGWNIISTRTVASSNFLYIY